jgi:hypothetical protein
MIRSWNNLHLHMLKFKKIGKLTVLNVVIIKTKVHLRRGYIDNRSWFWISWLCPLVFLFPQTFKLVYVAFPRIFKLFGFLIFRLWAYLMKVIPETGGGSHFIWYLCFYLHKTEFISSQWYRTFVNKNFKSVNFLAPTNL